MVVMLRKLKVNLRLYFNITNINNLNLILQGFIDLLYTKNYCRHDIGFTDKSVMILFPINVN